MTFLRLRNTILILFLLSYTLASTSAGTLFAKATAGVITGKIVDATSNEPLPGARIAVVGKHTGAISGFDGSYKLSLDPGDYSLKITYSGYLDTALKITVTEGEQITNLDVGLQRNAGKGKEVTVRSEEHT